MKHFKGLSVAVALMIVCCLSSAAAPPAPLEGTWRLSLAPETPGAAGSLRVDRKGVVHLGYDFRHGGRYVAACYDLREPAAFQTVSFRVSKPAEAVLAVRVTASDEQVFQETVSFASAEWRDVSFNMHGWTEHRGGLDDGTLRPPLRTIEILIDARGLRSHRGEVRIANLMAETAEVTATNGETAPKSPVLCLVSDFGKEVPYQVFGPATLDGGLWTVDLAKDEKSSIYAPHGIPGRPTEFTLKLRGATPGHVLTVYLWSQNVEYTRAVGPLTGGEQTFTLPAPPAEGWNAKLKYKGDDPKIVQYPLQFVALELERGSGPAQTTTIELLEFRSSTQTATDTSVMLLAYLNEKGTQDGARALSAGCTGWSQLGTGASGTLTLTVRSWEEEVLFEEKAPWVLPADGTRQRETWGVKIPAGLQFAEAEFKFEYGGKTALRRATFARPMEDAGDATLRPESPWGMNVCLGRFNHEGGLDSQMEKAAAMAQAAGVKWDRGGFIWAHSEPERGKFEFDRYDQEVDCALRHGMNICALLCYWSNWTSPYTQEGIDDFCRWASVVVNRYKDRIKVWEIYNEPNHPFFWNGPKELYPVLLAKCYKAIKEADPEAQVLGLSLAGIDLGFLGMCMDMRAPFDGLAFHPYRENLIESHFLDELRNLSERLGGRPLWITEMGVSTNTGGADERTQATYLARSYLTAATGCRNISWYDFRNDGDNSYEREYNFGVIRRDLTPKPAYRALATVCRTFADGAPQLLDDLPTGLYAFARGNITALWSGEGNAQIECRLGDGQPRVLNLMGEELTPVVKGNRLTMSLRPGCPVFITDAAVGKIKGRVEPSNEPKTIRF